MIIEPRFGDSIGFIAPKRPTFQPVMILDVQTEPDRLAEKMVYSLLEDVRATMNTERSRQTTIGISEIGDDCDRCVCRKLSGLYPKPSDPSWKAQVGTFIHAGLEEHFQHAHGTSLREPTDEKPAYHMERRVQVMEYKGLDLGGSCDLFVQGKSFGLVCDWKTQGAASLKKTTAGKLSSAYIAQMHTYGLGYEMLGFTVTHVVLYALPRDGDLNEAKPVLMAYDRQIAVAALARIQNFIDAAELVGWPALIRTQPRASPCWDCGRYELAEEANFLGDMVG